MQQNINKINAVTRDYRGNKSVLNERVIEGVNTSAYDLSTDLQLTENIEKTIIINNVNGGSIYLPNAQTLIKGWKITIINESKDNDCDIYYYNSSTLFTSVNKNKMTELLFLGSESDTDEEGNWKVVILSENKVDDETNIYTTNLYTTTQITYLDLKNNLSYVENKILARIKKNVPVKSIYIKPKTKFSGVNLKLDIGTLNNTQLFYKGLDLTSETDFHRDLFNEIINQNYNDYIIGHFYIDGVSSNTWTKLNTNISDNITQACYGNNVYILQAGTNLYINTSASTWNPTVLSIESLFSNLNSYSNYSLQYVKKTGLFYFFGVNSENRFCYYTSENGITWSDPIINEEFVVNSIEFITNIYTDENDKWFITVKVGDDNYIIYVDDITIPSTFSLYELKYDDVNLTNINSITTSSSHLIINTDATTYYSLNNGYGLQILEEYDENTYRYKYLNDTYIRFPYNNTDNIIKYTFDFDTNIDNWQTKTLTSVYGNINYLYDVNYNEGLWSAFKKYRLEDDEHFDLIISTDFFNTILICNNNFNTTDVNCITGNASGYIICGDNGLISYSENDTFINLTQGYIEFVIEYAADINPINLKNAIIQGQIMPLGTVIHYPFARTIPAGYIRLDGQIITNVEKNFPEFYELLQKNPKMIYTNVSDWNNAYNSNNGNVPKFGWTDDSKTSIRVPAINCYIKGTTLNAFDDFAQFSTYNIMSGSGSVTTRLESVTYPYIMSYYHTAQQIGTYNLQELGELLDKIDVEVIQASKLVNDITVAVPPGTIVPFAGNNRPTGYLWCDGSSMSRTTYSKLFNAIGTIYGSDDTDTFKLPHLDDGRFIEATTTNSNKKSAAGLPNHYHVFGSNGFHSNGGRFTSTNFSSISGTMDPNLPSRGSVGWNGSGHDSAEFRGGETFSGCMVTTLVKSTTASVIDGIYGADKSTIQPKSIKMRYIIKY